VPEESCDLPRSIREKQLEVIPRTDGGFDFRAMLVDRSVNGRYEDHASGATIHDFRLSGTIDADLVLTRIDAVADAHPFAACPGATAAVSGLLGRELGVGWRREVLQLFAGARGCTHLTTLLLGLSEVITLVYFQRMNRETAYGPDSRASGAWLAGGVGQGIPLEGACHALATDGPVLAGARNIPEGH
jgi:hypothetical protein